MWCTGAKFIKEYERCIKDWIKKNKHKRNVYGETLITNLYKEINKK